MVQNKLKALGRTRLPPRTVVGSVMIGENGEKEKEKEEEEEKEEMEEGGGK